jgi:tetratricopeptide (TPR) repeat protein
MLITLKPDSVEARLEQGEILLRLGQKSTADKAFEEAVSRGASRINVNRRIAQFHIERKEFAQARDIYQSMVDDGTASVIIYSQLSELLLAQDNADKGEKILRDGLKKFPDSAYLTLRLGSYLASLRQYDKALPVFKRATELAPSDVTVWKSYSLALLRAGKKSEAVDAASKMVAMQPGNIELSVIYATMLDADNQTAEAEKVYREILTVAPGHALSLNNLANILSDQKKYAEAEDMARRAVNALSDNGSIQDTLGWVLYHRGKLSEASDVLAKASRLSPGIATIRYHQGVVLAERKQGAEAKVALQKALQLNTKQADWVSDAKARLQKL